MKEPNITIYGSKSCSDTVRARAFLDQRGDAYEYKDLDETPEINEYVAGLNGGKRVLPTIRVDNQNFFNPKLSDLELALATAAEDR